MSWTDFDQAVEFTLRWEGGYENDPDDPGGETNWGISKRAYPNLDIKNLTKEQAIVIYESDYWIPSGCSLWEWPLNLIVFDTAVNCGVHRASLWMTFSEDWKDLLLKRIKHYTQLNNKKYLQGWLNRTMALWDYATQERVM